jgi:hypothetical protein
MRLKTTLALAVALMIATAAVAVAAAKWQTGKYTGKTQGKYLPARGTKLRAAHISFTVGKHKVSRIRVEIRVRCADDTHTSFVTAHGGSLTLNSKGRFSGGARSAGRTGRDNISGRVSGEHAAGIVRSYDKEDANGNEDPNGQKCDSGRIHWMAHKKESG